MKKFSEYLDEMAKISNNEYNGEPDDKESFLFYINNPKYIKDIITHGKYTIIRSGDDVFFLTNKEKEFLGMIETTSNTVYKDGYLSIVSSKSNIKKDFYLIMFTQILNMSDVKGLLSDVSLTNKALKSHEKLNKANAFTYKVLSDNKIYDFTKEKLLSDRKNRILITKV